MQCNVTNSKIVDAILGLFIAPAPCIPKTNNVLAADYPQKQMYL